MSDGQLSLLDYDNGPAGSSAVISSCGVWRYRLDRANPIESARVAAVLMANPSVADHRINDHTVTKVHGLTERAGFGRFIVGNKMAYRATDIKELRSATDPIGPENDQYLHQIISEADVCIPAWGPLAKFPKHLRHRWLEVAAIADHYGKPMMCWGTAKDGQPRHPLMLAYSTPLIEWERPNV